MYPVVLRMITTIPQSILSMKISIINYFNQNVEIKSLCLLVGNMLLLAFTFRPPMKIVRNNKFVFFKWCVVFIGIVLNVNLFYLFLPFKITSKASVID